MIYDSIDNIDKYIVFEDIFKALKLIGTLTSESAYPVCSQDGNVICRLNEYDLVSETGKKFEAHDCYIDIHYTLAGGEGIAVAPRNVLENVEPISKEKDIGFFTGIPTALVSVDEGMFLVCFPEDAHMPGLKSRGSDHVIKVIAKVKIKNSME